MKLTIIKVHKGHQIDTTSLSFNDVEDYIKYLNDLGFDIPFEDALQDMENGEVQYNISLAPTDIN